MWITRINPDDKRTFTCPVCDISQTAVIEHQVDRLRYLATALPSRQVARISSLSSSELRGSEASLVHIRPVIIGVSSGCA